jgi:RNA polymerase sigma-70 factor (ECF subfamily)
MTKNGPKTEDASLVDKLKRGDPDAVEEMYNANINLVYSLVYNQVDKNRDAAQEIVQETFIAAIRAIKYFQVRSSISTWLCSIANRKVADFYRRKKREDEHRISQGVDPEKTGDLADEGPADYAMDIRQALSNLPLNYRQVIILKYIEGFSVADISGIMGKTEKSIEGLLSRARKELRSNLEHSDEG